jgi:hypothetical protein
MKEELLRVLPDVRLSVSLQNVSEINQKSKQFVAKTEMFKLVGINGYTPTGQA